MAQAERLQKVLAAAGVGSRRACEELIGARRVTVNGRVARLGDKVDPATAEIYVDGERLIADTRLVYLAMNKPRGVVATMADERGGAGVAPGEAGEGFVGARRVRVIGGVARGGNRVAPATAEIYVDGERLIADTRLVYLAMNKPRGVVATMADERGRAAVADYLGNL